MEIKPSFSSSGDDHDAVLSTKLRYATWGIFKIAYIPSTGSPFGMLSSCFPALSALPQYWKSLKVLRRLASDMWHMSKWHCAIYLMYELATVSAPALSLFAAYYVYFNLHGIASGTSPYDTSMKLVAAQIWVIIWLMGGNLSQMRYKPLLSFRGHIGGHMRYRYMPDLPSFTLLRDVLISLEVVFQVLAVIHIAWRMESLQGSLLIIAMLHLTLSFTIVPTNLVGGAGYTFWTENELYKSLIRTHAVIFDDRHRPTTIRDGITENISQEYEDKLRALGPVQADTWILSMGLTPSWYWMLLAAFIFNSLMALYVLSYQLYPPGIRATSLISCMALVHYMVYSMNDSFQAAKGMGQIKSCHEIARICEELSCFYEFLDFGSSTCKRSGSETKGATKGATLVLDNVMASAAIDSTRYARQIPTTTFDMTINGGEVVGVVINSEHERATLGEIVCGLLPITNGSIIWDGKYLAEGSTPWPRQEMAYATPGDTVYPLSLKDNVLMGLDASQKRHVTDQDIESAARICELSPVITTYGWYYIPDGATIVGNSVMPQPDLEAWKALNKHYPPPGISKLTEAQRFAIILCRVYIRVRHGNARLIFLEKPDDRPVTCPALEGLCKLARDEGKTLMVVASEANMPPLDNDRVKLDRIIRL
ncbi:hypothetical protein D9619_003829 [Psilocybe cf. subviscida]|uniref:ABC transporter domain-containing protein n=1 Tax=Psilocybe cf. subviscida TaxID=2480587 RepID=A0A8H5AXW8_9AGAR|nr:hypothetical protein D9619_003829 [Psilocybe cf. subviscida]